MKGTWECKRFQESEQGNLPGGPTSNVQTRMRTAETMMLFIIAILVLSLIWVTNFNNRCHPNQPSLIPLGDDKTYDDQKTLVNNLEAVESNNASTVNKRTEVSIENRVSSVYQSAINPLLLFQKVVNGPPPACTESTQCSITCSDYPSRNFHDMVDFLNNQFDCDKATLTITGSNFEGRVIERGWLQGLKMQITQLRLLNNLKCNAAHIGAEAFSGDPFDSLTYLTIEEGDLKYLQKSVFKGSVLNNVEIRRNQKGSTSFEAGIFEPIRTNLQMLQLQQCIDGGDTLKNITGANAVMLSALAQLDLRYNVIPEIKADSFTKVAKVWTIWLDSCLIESIDGHAFDHLRDLETLTLAGNLLTTLPEHIFYHTTSLSKIGLQNNPWTCDCPLEWLQLMYRNERRKFIKPLYCGRTDFNNTDFGCGSTTTGAPLTSGSGTVTEVPTTKTTGTSLITTTKEPPTELTTSTTQSTTTTTAVTTSTSTSPATTSIASTSSPVTRKPNNERIRCLQLPSSDLLGSDDEVTIVLEKHNCSLSYTVTDENNGVLWSIKPSSDGENKTVNFLVHNVIDDVFRCYKNVAYNRVSKLEDLGYNKTYIGCVLMSNETTVSPQNCIAITTPLAYKDRPWLTNDVKTTVIIGLSVAGVIFIVLTVVFIYCCLRQRLQLVVDSQPRFVVPTTTGYHEYSAPSYRSISDGYLTPRTVRSEKYYELPISPPRFRRKSIQVSYQAPGYLGRYSFTRRRNSNHNTEPLYEIPPPLPPNHPVCVRHDMTQFM